MTSTPRTAKDRHQVSWDLTTQLPAYVATGDLAELLKTLGPALELDLAGTVALLEAHAPNVVATISAAAWQEGHDDGWDSGRDTSCQAMGAYNPYPGTILRNRAGAAYLATVRIGKDTGLILTGHNLSDDVVTEAVSRHLQAGSFDKKTITHENRVRVEGVVAGALEEHYGDASWVDVAFDQADDHNAVTVVAVERTVMAAPYYPPETHQPRPGRFHRSL